MKSDSNDCPASFIYSLVLSQEMTSMRTIRTMEERSSFLYEMLEQAFEK
jgi:hypothetical protein